MYFMKASILHLLLLVAPGASAVTLRGNNEQRQLQGTLSFSYDEDLDLTGSSSASAYGCGTVFTTEISDPSAEDPTACEEEIACGTVTFQCPDTFNGLTEISYSISGLTPGKHALHVHQEPIGTGGEDTCTSTGGHWNPQNNNHGSNLDSQRHIGDLGNILADETGLAEGTLLAYVPLSGPLGIAGRAVVVHAGTDDLGTGGDDGSRAVGNAGARPGCGNIVEM